MIQRTALRLEQVIEDRTGRADGCRIFFGEAESFQRGRLEMFRQVRRRRIVRERPGGPFRDHALIDQVLRQRRSILGDQAFARSNPRQFITQLRGRKCGGVEAARREFGPGDTDQRLVLSRFRRAVSHSRQKVAFARVEQRVIGQRPWRDDTRHLSLDQTLRLAADLPPVRTPRRDSQLR